MASVCAKLEGDMFLRLSRPSAGGWLVAFVVIVAAVACGGGSPSEPASPPAEGRAPAVGAAATAAPPLATAPSAPAPAAAPPAPADGIATQDHQAPGVQVTLLEVKRTSGDTLTVRWRYRNGGTTAERLYENTASWYDKYRLTGPTYLVDPVNKKKYLVVTDAENNPIASEHRNTIEPGEAFSAWAKFPAPPADVEKISVYVSGVPPFDDAPIVK
jgi:hypothetical protein